MATTLSTAEYVERSARAYEHQLGEHLRRYGTPVVEPETAGRQAAVLTAAGQAWAKDVGPFLDTAGVCAALGGVTKQAVSQRVNSGRLLGLRLAADGTNNRRLVYPAWQFRAGVLDRLPGVLEAAGYSPDSATTGWTIASWLTTPDPHLGGLAPLQLLAAGDVEMVVGLAGEVAVSLGVTERAAVASDRGRT